MIKKILYALMILCLTGCATVSIPRYIKDDYPYKEKISADYDSVLKAAHQALKDLHWTVGGESEPAVFEESKDIQDPNNKQVMLFTEIRQSSMFLWTHYSRINVFLRGYKDEFTEVEIRYLGTTSVMFMKFAGYHNDRLAKKLLAKIKKNLTIQNSRDLGAPPKSQDADGKIPHG
ncbi:MAG: hypothetical protein HQL24_00820 [Candidatus Omnitrophica bacterium]|nr:hypothetical protein [Candidatus Omnitrophota bacterium]